MVAKGTPRVGNYPAARYLYRAGDKHPYEFKACEGCRETSWIQKRRRFCSRRCSKLGNRNPTFKGDAVGYLGAHSRVYRSRGRADAHACCACGLTAAHWAWIHGLPPHDPSSYQPMCASCHSRYDAVQWTHCKRGHELTEDNLYWSRDRTRRQCKTCAKERAAGQRNAA